MYSGDLKMMTNRKLSKAEKKAIIDKHSSAPASEVFTDDEWARLMFATHSEIKDVMQDIADDISNVIDDYKTTSPKT